MTAVDAATPVYPCRQHQTNESQKDNKIKEKNKGEKRGLLPE